MYGENLIRACIPSFDHCMASVFVGVWKPVMDRGRREGHSFVEVELGAPGATSTNEFLEAGSRFLSQQGIPHCPVTVVASERSRARLVMRITV